MANDTSADIGMVLYTDGGARPSRGYAGWGVHAYSYEMTPLEKPGRKLGIPTEIGYVNEGNNAKPVHSEGGVWEAQLSGKHQCKVNAYKPLTYIDAWAAVGSDDTNNRAELLGLYNGLKLVDEVGAKKAHFRLDSEYAMLGLKDRYPKWQAQNWVGPDGKERKNRADWEKTISLYESLKDRVEITFSHVDGHSGDIGNDRADINATRGVFDARNGHDEAEVVYSDPKGYGSVKAVPNKLFAYNRGYFLANKEDDNLVKSGHWAYPIASAGQNSRHDDVDGKAVSDRGFGLLFLKNREPIIESIKTAFNEGADHLYQSVVRINLDRLLSPNQLQEYADYGSRFFWQPDSSRILNLSEDVLAAEHKPTHLAFRTINVFGELEILLNKYLDHKNGITEEVRPISVTDISDLFFEELPLKKKGKEVGTTYGLKASFTNLVKAFKPQVQTLVDGEVVSAQVILTPGLDIPHRNTFLGLAPRKPKVYVLTVDSSAKAFSYHVVIDMDEDVSIWSSFYSNTVYRLGGKK